MRLRKSDLLLIIPGALILGLIVYQTVQRLREPDPAEQSQPDVNKPGDDPRLVAAEAEARRRWPEFLDAFAKRESETAYAVRAKFSYSGGQEWLWLQVESVEDDAIRGRLDNRPVHVAGLKLGDLVTVHLGDIDDWIVARTGHPPEGGFTAKAVNDTAHLLPAGMEAAP